MYCLYVISGRKWLEHHKGLVSILCLPHPSYRSMLVDHLMRVIKLFCFKMVVGNHLANIHIDLATSEMGRH